MEKGSFLRLAGDLIGKSYADIADEASARHSRAQQFRKLLEQRRLPEEPWGDLAVTLFLEELANADSNNHLGNVGVGEREGRIFSRLVAQRHFNFAHGIGRSGDIAALQPKAAGSSLLFALARRLALDALHICGVKAARAALPVPFATGLSLTLCFSSLRSVRPASARFIIFSRIDQKACLKSIYSAGFQAEVVEMIRAPGSFALQTDLAAIAAAIDRLKPENVLCVLSTTSTFAPREPDQVDAIARLCQEKGVAHVINNAYGLQCTKCCHLVDQAIRTGRVDAFVQSTDKNFLTPVGGAIIASGDPSSIQKIAATYPGRAGSGPILDLFITLLQMGNSPPVSFLILKSTVCFVPLGQAGLRQLLEERRELYRWFRSELEKVCDQIGSRILLTPNNRISIALDLSFLAEATRNEISRGRETRDESPGKRTEATDEEAREEEDRLLTFFGSALFKRRCSGLRVVPCYSPESSSSSPASAPKSRTLPATPSSASPPADCSSSTSSSTSSAPSSSSLGGEGRACASASESIERNAGKADRQTSEEGLLACPFKLEDQQARKAWRGNQKTICGHTFSNYGSHCENFPVPYCTVAVAIGAKKQELEDFLPRFLRVVEEIKKKARAGTK
uniref:O-phosphoseryl-tRNA(Sec) selenium transferase n=1 Tax=Neospora caninum (strain Liverpool) TaxID=572307 RepID=A0A0F7UM90_NEOCL|nr:TPA: soluble liver antigen/liver pancreas antigen domain-containing protein, putative [Neospora caninum Liverpool]